MKKIFSSLACIFIFIDQLVAVETSLIDAFIRKHTDTIYQDVIIGEKIYTIGSDICDSRYKLFTKILEKYEGPFSVLDLGAAQGYFSFRIAKDYPQSSIVMIESNDTSYYAHNGDMLSDLCFLNQNLPNIFYLKKRVNLADLNYLNSKEHFDVIIAFLVVHLMEPSLKDQIEILNSLLKLGDNVIIEVANDVGVVHTSYVEYLATKLNAEFLGEVKRHRLSSSSSTGKLFWFKSKNVATEKKDDSFTAIKRETFINLNGVYPLNY